MCKWLDLAKGQHKKGGEKIFMWKYVKRESRSFEIKANPLFFLFLFSKKKWKGYNIKKAAATGVSENY